MLAIGFSLWVWHSYYQVGLGLVKMVRYFKTSRSIRVIAPLNRDFKSELRWHLQYKTSHIKYLIYLIYIHLFWGKNKQTLWICHKTYMAQCISRRANKFPQVRFHHEIRLYIAVGVIHTVEIIPTPYSLEDFKRIGQMKGVGLRNAGHLKLTFHFNFNLSFSNCVFDIL